MATGKHVMDVHLGNFQESVIEISRQVPVVVDFWAPWCGPCRALGPVLEKLAEEYDGRFILAKINSDENPELSREYQVRGIPAVKAFRDGRVADEFTGALPESAVRQFIERLLPPLGDEWRREALLLLERGETAQAEALLHKALEANPGNDRARLELARMAVHGGRFADAEALVTAMSPTFRLEPEVSGVMALIGFANAIQDAPDLPALTESIATSKGDARALAMYQRAARLILRGDLEGALEQLMEMVERHRSYQDDLARKTVLQVFTLLGNQGALVDRFRTRLSRALF